MKLHVDYLSDEQIRGFDHYKYSSVDTSPVSNYISHPFWNQVVKLYPKWLAPNVLTLSGFVCVMLSFTVVSFYDYYMWASSDTHPQYTPIPNWVWLLCAIMTFAGHTLDGTDGKQARRTDMCGATGELFDHGIDSWLTIPFTLTLFSIFGRDDYSIPALRLLSVIICVQFVFVTSHWEKYITGILFLPWGYDISQYFLVVVYLVTYFGGGYEMWKFYVITSWSLTPAIIAEMSFYLSCCFLHLPMTLYNIKKSYDRGENRQSSVVEAVLPLLSTCVLFALATAWALVSPSNVIDTDPRAFIWFMGTVFANIATRLIIAQMTATRCEVLNMMLIPFAGSFALSILFPSIEISLVRLMALLVTVAHVHYGVCVVEQMCNHFGMSALRVRSSSAETAKVDYHLVDSRDPDVDI